MSGFHFSKMYNSSTMIRMRHAKDLINMSMLMTREFSSFHEIEIISSSRRPHVNKRNFQFVNKAKCEYFHRTTGDEAEFRSFPWWCNIRMSN